jgi:hypothetical protein
MSGQRGNQNLTIDQHHRHWRDVPGHKHSKLFISRPCKKRADDLLKLRRHQLRMVAAILTGHAPVRTHLCTMGLFEGDPVCRFVNRRLKQCSTSSVTAKRWLADGSIYLGIRLSNPSYTGSYSQGPLPLHQRHKAAESVLKWKFRAPQ